MRASQRGNALFRAGTQPLRQPRATTSRHPPLEIEPSRRVAQRRKTTVRECARAIAELTERRLASAQADTFENHQRSRASLAMASGAISEQEQGEFLMASGAISEQQVGVRTSGFAHPSSAALARLLPGAPPPAEGEGGSAPQSDKGCTSELWPSRNNLLRAFV